MEYIDTHFHVWELKRFDYPWPTPGMKIFKDYFPCGLESGVECTPVKHAIFVQCLNGSKEEAGWVIDMATRHPIIKGVVAGLDLTSPDLDTIIKPLKQTGFLKGVRHILDLEADDWITRDDVSRGLDVLASNDLSYDLLVRPHHLKYIPKVVSGHPNLRFIINHIAKPAFSEGKLGAWGDDMAEIAKSPNVCCKISGLVSEQEPDKVSGLDFQPFVDHVLSVFGVDRCIWGSDWPVLEMADYTYKQNLELVQKLLTKLSASDKAKVFRENAIKFYKLDV